MMTVKRYSKLKMFALYSLSVLVNVTPLIVIVALNWKIFIKTQREGVALTITGIVWFIFLISTFFNSLSFKLNRCATMIIIFVVLELMKPLLNHMCIFAGAAALGALIDTILIRPIIKRYKELRIATTTADITTMQVKQAVQEVLEAERSGRV